MYKTAFIFVCILIYECIYKCVYRLIQIYIYYIYIHKYVYICMYISDVSTEFAGNLMVWPGSHTVLHRLKEGTFLLYLYLLFFVR
jgi:hypothetical protein